MYDDNYCNKLLFNDFEDALSGFNLIQVVNFNTWSRLVGTVLRSSILDHIYIKDPTVLSNLRFSDPFFGDHVLIKFKVNAFKNIANPVKLLNYLNISLLKNYSNSDYSNLFNFAILQKYLNI